MTYPPTLPSTRVGSDPLPSNHAADHTAVVNALTDIINELGATPKGSEGSLSARLTAIEALCTPTDWTPVTYANFWVDFGGVYQAVEYRKIGDNVQLRGMMKSGTQGVRAFTLPVGFRPPAQQLFTALAYGAVESTNKIIIQADGQVIPAYHVQTTGYSGNTYVSLDGISFSTTAAP